MATMNISLPDPMKRWVEEQIKSGHYSNASDYVRDLIRKDQDYKDQRETLLAALVAGEENGEFKGTLEEIWQGVKKKHGI